MKKQYWRRAQIKMQVINTMRERVFESLKDNPVKLAFAKSEIDQLENDLTLFNQNLTKIIDKYSQFLPKLKTTRQVCENCDNTNIVQIDDVSVCQDCSAIHSFLIDQVQEKQTLNTFDKIIKSQLKKFRERIAERGIDNDGLLFDYERVAVQVKENDVNRMPNKDFVLLCLLLKNKATPPKNLSIPNGEAPLVTAVTRCRDIFSKLKWKFPNQEIKDYVLKQKRRKTKSSLEKIL